MATKKSGGNPRSIPGNKEQVNFNIDKDVLGKIRGIAQAESVTNSDVLNRAAAKYVTDYEGQNGKVKPVKTKPKDQRGSGLV